MNALTWIDTAVCLGNGQSRQGLDLTKMKDYATVIGCNAIYRDFTPDILVALDLPCDISRVTFLNLVPLIYQV